MIRPPVDAPDRMFRGTVLPRQVQYRTVRDETFLMGLHRTLPVPSRHHLHRP